MADTDTKSPEILLPTHSQAPSSGVGADLLYAGDRSHSPNLTSMDIALTTALGEDDERPFVLPWADTVRIGGLVVSRAQGNMTSVGIDSGCLRDGTETHALAESLFGDWAAGLLLKCCAAESSPSAVLGLTARRKTITPTRGSVSAPHWQRLIDRVSELKGLGLEAGYLPIRTFADVYPVPAQRARGSEAQG